MLALSILISLIVAVVMGIKLVYLNFKYGKEPWSQEENKTYGVSCLVLFGALLVQTVSLALFTKTFPDWIAVAMLMATGFLSWFHFHRTKKIAVQKKETADKETTDK